MLGVLVNALAILAGSFVGLLAKKGIPEKITNAIMTAIALCVIYIGVSGMLKGENTLVLIVSMVLGTAVGTLFLQTLWKTCLFYSKINTDLHPAA